MARALIGSNVPANPPVKLYWSATAYDRATHALIRNQPYSSRASTTPSLRKNADGSVDVYFGPKAPPGKEANWVPTSSAGKLRSCSAFMVPRMAPTLYRDTRFLADAPDRRHQAREHCSARHSAAVCVVSRTGTSSTRCIEAIRWAR